MNKILYKKPSESETVKTEVVCPNDTNPMGILQGGRLVEWMDIAAAVCAQTHAGKTCVTASINRVNFYKVAKVGDMIIISARITRAFKTSMEIFVQVFARKILAGEKFMISEAYFTFVALNENWKAESVVAVKPVTLSEKKQFNAALKRKTERIDINKLRII